MAVATPFTRDQELFALARHTDCAFPEFGWTKRGSHWVAAHWPASFPCAAGDNRPDRLVVYADRPFWIKVHGHHGVRFLDLVNGGRRPRGADFAEAVRKLCQLAGVACPSPMITPEQAEAIAAAEARRSILDMAMRYAQTCLWSTEGEVARAYLLQRGFRDEDIKVLGVGLYGSTSEVRKCLMEAGFDITQVEAAGVLWEELEGYILIPWADDYGRPLTIYGRWSAKTPPEGKKKTIALPGEGTNRSPLYFDRAQSGGQKDLIVVEGVFDAALLQVRGDSRVIASVAAQMSTLQVETLEVHPDFDMNTFERLVSLLERA